MKKTTFILVSLTALFFAPFYYGGNKLSAQIITTVCGTATAGYNGDGGLATVSEVNRPSSVAFDKNGNMYIADNVNNRIRKVDAITGVISTVAGNGSQGYNGDGIQATAAKLYQPWDISLDAAGNIYIGDWGNARVRKVTVSTGIITTFAGTGTAGYNGDGIQATAAQVDYAEGSCTDKAGNFYFTDTDGQRIRKVNTSGVISTVAGTGIAGYNGDGIQATAAQLHNPCSVYIDTLNNLYIADYLNNEVRKVNLSTGIITSVAGNGTGGYNGDGGIATASEVYNPSSVFVDSHLNIYISDYSNLRIRKVDFSTGIISTVAGSGIVGYNGDGIQATSADIYNPWGVYVTANAFYFAEFGTGAGGSSRIRKVTISTLGVNEATTISQAVELFPNPNNGNFTIQWSAVSGQSLVQVYNMLGEKVYSSQFSIHDSKLSIDLSGQPNGLYFYRLTSPNGVIGTGKFVINK